MDQERKTDLLKKIAYYRWCINTDRDNLKRECIGRPDPSIMRHYNERIEYTQNILMGVIGTYRANYGELPPVDNTKWLTVTTRN